jgi:L-threonylcarbamoyladenylate synthase
VRRWIVDPERPDPAVLAETGAVVRGGGVIVFPTDTLYGLACDPANEGAVERVFALKGRAAREALPLIVAGLAEAARFGRLTPLARRLAAAFWPGALTLVVEDGGLVAPSVHAGTGSVAMRVPANVVARALAAAAGGAVTSTSANRSGLPAPSTAGEAERLAGQVDGVLDGGPARGGPPSTIVDARGAAPSLVREGVVPYERVLEALERR